jgi:hypothetical protein
MEPQRNDPRKEDKHQREILEAIRELSVNQGVLKEKVEAHLKKTEKLEASIDKIEDEFKMVHKHDYIIKGSLWLYGFIFTFLAYKLFPHSK